MKTTPLTAGLVSAFLPVVGFATDAISANQLATSESGNDTKKQAEIIAVKIRTQGYHCDTLQSVERDRQHSRPDNTV